MDQKHKRFRESRIPLRDIRKTPRSMYARVPQAMAQFVLKIEKLSHIMGPTPILEMARAYGLRPRLWLLINFNPGLALTGFRTILSCFQQVNLTWARDPIKKPALGQRSTSKNTWPRWVLVLSPRYGHVILVSRCLVLTGVNWSKHECPMSKKYTVNQGFMSCQPIIWKMAAILRDSTVVVAVVVVRTRPRAIPLAMITMRKSIHGFPLVSYMGMELRYYC